MDYMSKRANMEMEVKKIAKDIFVDGIFRTELNKNNKTAQDIAKNPVFALMGGEHYFKGITLEKRHYTNDRLKQVKELADNMQEIKDGIGKEADTKDKFKEIGMCFRPG